MFEDYNINLKYPDYRMATLWLKEHRDVADGAVISFNVLENFDLYNNYPLQTLGQNMSFDIIPSIRFKSFENIEFIIFNPKQRSFKLLEKIEREKSELICTILFNIFYDYNISLSPLELISEINGTDEEDLSLITKNDIRDSLLKNKHCISRGEAERIMDNTWLEFNHPSMMYILNTLLSNNNMIEEMYLLNPEIVKDYLTPKVLKCFEGIIVQNIHLENDMKKMVGEFEWNIRLGSGEMI